ncbi:MAG: alpha/beta hydrolase [Bauldia sp.]
MIDLNVQVSGPEGAPPLLLVHALGANLTFWDRFVAEMGEDVRCIRYDQRGFGRSPVPARPWTISDHVEDIEAIRHALGLDTLSIMGTAVGGVISLYYAHTYPERVRSVVFTNPTMGAKRELSLARLEKMKSGGGGMDFIAEEAVSTAYGPLPHDAHFVHYRDDIFSKNDPKGYEMTVRGIVGTFIDPILDEMRCPVLVAGGALDYNNPPDGVARAVADRLRNATFVVAPSASHLGPYQAPREFAEFVKPFLSSLP